MEDNQSGYARWESLHEAYERVRTAMSDFKELGKKHGVKLSLADVDKVVKEIAANNQIIELKSQGCRVSEYHPTAGVDVQTASPSAEAPAVMSEARLGSFASNRGRMHVTEFLANLSKLFDSNPSIEGNVFLSVDKDLNVVPDKSVGVFTVIKCQFKSNVGLQASSKD